MEIDTRFATRLDTVGEVPEPLRRILVDNIDEQASVRMLVHAPAVLTIDERSPATAPPVTPVLLVPATVLAVTNHGWILASGTEDGGVTVEKSTFSDTLFLELTSILLSGQLKIDFA
jgi:hypothetical protein